MRARALRRRPLAVLLAALALLGGGWALSGPRRSPAARFQRAWWYWHHPFRLSSKEALALRRGECARLYVHAGTLEARRGQLTLQSRQRFLTAAPCDLYAVLRVHPAAHRELLAPEGPERVASLIQSERWPATVRGVQIDADIPTVRLDEYAGFLTALRKRLPGGWSLSVTALPAWLGTRGYARVCDAVDEVAPQFYGNRWPVAGKKPPPLWEHGELARLASQATAGRARAWIGLPAYGRCLVLDASGRPLGVRHDLDPEALLSNPDWSVAATGTGTEAASEDALRLRASRGTTSGRFAVEAGTSLWFQWPRVEALQRAEEALLAGRDHRLAGVCYFRWPAPGEPLALDPQPHTAPPAPSLELSEQNGRLVVRNRGADAPRLPEGVQIELTGRVSEIETEEPADYRRGDSPCSPLRADRVRFSRPLLRPGLAWTVCRLGTEGPLKARLSWRDGEGQLRSTDVALGTERRTP